MTEINLNTIGLNMTAVLIKETHPRVAVCWDKVMLLNSNDQAVAVRNILDAFDLGEITEARREPEVIPDSYEDLVGQTKQLLDNVPYYEGMTEEQHQLYRDIVVKVRAFHAVYDNYVAEVNIV